MSQRTQGCFLPFSGKGGAASGPKRTCLLAWGTNSSPYIARVPAKATTESSDRPTTPARVIALRDMPLDFSADRPRPAIERGQRSASNVQQTALR